MFADWLSLKQDTFEGRKEHFHRVLRNTECNSVGGDFFPTILTPDMQALRDVVLSTRHVGAPFDDLRQFKESCISGSTLPRAVSVSATVWTVVLQLYVSSFCRPAVCKDLWNYIIGQQPGKVRLAGSTMYTPDQLTPFQAEGCAGRSVVLRSRRACRHSSR